MLILADNRYIEFQKCVRKSMGEFPEKFEIVFEEFESELYDLESLWKNDVAIFRVNIKAWDHETKWYAKMAVLLFLDDYFGLPHNEIDDVQDERINKCFRAIAYLIP